MEEWKCTTKPVLGMEVDFVVVDGITSGIYLSELAENKPVVAPSNSKITAGKTSNLAIVSLVFSILGLFLLGIIGAIVAIICGHVAHHQIKVSDGKITGRGMAIAGFIIGYIGLVISIVLLITGFFLLSVG